MLMTYMPRSKRSKKNAIQYHFVIEGTETNLQPGMTNRLLRSLFKHTATSTALCMTGCSGIIGGTASQPDRLLTARLEHVLRGLSQHVFPGTSFDPLGVQEPEPYFLALGPSEEQARCVGADFLQTRVLWADADATLHILHPLKNEDEVKLTPRSSKRIHRVLKFRRLGFWRDRKEADMSASSISKDKVDAYRATHYRFVAYGAHCALYVGFKSKELEHLYQATGANTCVYIKAFNPLGQRRGREENLEAQMQLKAALAQYTPHIFYGEGVDPGGAWEPEPSFLALGVTEEVARELATRFAQDAVVWATSDAVPRLLLLR